MVQSFSMRMGKIKEFRIGRNRKRGFSEIKKMLV
jgi:hypothetical protein